MSVRPFIESDRPFLRTLFLAARRTNWHWLDGREWQLEDFDRIILGERVMVANRESQRVGFAAVLPNDNFLHSLFVDPDWQGRGIGSELLRAVHQSFTSTGKLKCMSANRRALDFYQQHGWQQIGSGEGDQGPYLLLHYRLK
ncbi:GNAT family N-acetyltransferase [Erwinia psidii]|uniref:N-acetyltransferase n=1 Tax=Erwinia psidii TaxID=69224 RepID=A0A3N6V3Y8_9GAMM|nr:GNAT family N-acetyltransferase [Erwinia psidii]MCX8956495.1 N-acetyltransferase [Erwinia psidii]MCX8962341.1 N-acetyltransferase [Erwinia psidii]MCX8965888.1 N-acetyltransferase [Erwinia psidii]RQM39825.1 N-acetyltransferase [Erwinia psidii]